MQTAGKGTNTAVLVVEEKITKQLSMDEKMMREKLVQVLERGKESATHIRRSLIDHHQLDAHSLDVLNSFATALSMVHYNFHSFNDHQDNQGLKGPNPTLKSHVSEDWEAPSPNAPKDARGSYKRRNTERAVEIETQHVDDRYAWRKYGQKFIQHTKHPRNYYRCTHKIEQGCRATKQVQQISDNPAKYKIIYYGHHTCKTPPKTPPGYNLDLIDDQDNNSSVMLSFETPNPKHGLNPFMLSSSSSSSTTTTSAVPMSTVDLIDEQEYTPIKDEIPLEPLDQHHEAHMQCPSSSDFLSTTFDLTSTSFLSDDVISLAEIYSSAASPYSVGEDYSNMMADFSQVFQDSYLLRA